MCGILAIFGEEVDVPPHLLTHRGPDDYNSVIIGKCRMDFYRLKINDMSDMGMQPFVRGKEMLVCNGEIYNHRSLRTGNEVSKSDCEVILPLIKDCGIMKALDEMNGDFAFAWTDGKRVMAARDPVGVRPLFYTRYSDDSIAFASEVKALLFLKSQIHVFPPGHVYDSYIDDFVCYHNGYWKLNTTIETGFVRQIREQLTYAVIDRLANTERDVGFLLSGGLDSSIIASIAARKIGKIKTFSVGLEGSPDLEAAKKVAAYIDSDHTEVVFTPEEGISHLKDVIRTLESYDTTKVRASVPMWILCKYIKENTNCRYIFSGEGSDELLGGYLYFHKAPNVEAFAYENMRRLRLIHQFDGLRADRCASAHGLDLVVPFLDKHFVNLCMSINQNEKIDTIEKKPLRQAFDGYLPDYILWRQKDGMSDAVGTEWVKKLKEHAEEVVDRVIICEHNSPMTKEESLYRMIFWDLYGWDNDHLISEIWRPKWTSIKDPSARLLIEEKT